jgi:NTE family protein
MGVDIVIAVDVEFPLYQPENMNSAIDITAQMLTILINKETLRQLADLGSDDFLVRPELGEYGSTNFAEIARTIDPGAEAIAAQADRLQALAMDPAAFSEHLSARRKLLAAPRQIDFIRVVDDGPLSARVLESRLLSEVGTSPDATQLSADAARLYGLELYEQVDYRVVERGDRSGVEFNTRAKS